jgi:serine/threonine protein kinase
MAHLQLMDVFAAVRAGRSAIEQFPTAGDPTYALAKPWILEVLKMCFAVDPKSRPSFAELVSHLESVGPTIQEIRDAEAEIQKRRDRRADVRSMRIAD